MDTLHLRRLALTASIGLSARERRAPRPLVADVSLQLDLRPAARSDRVRDTVNYAVLAASLRTAAAARPARLLETLACRLAARCLADRRVRGVELTLSKPDALPGAEAAITVRRGTFSD